jgi:hypothetical protein
MAKFDRSKIQGAKRSVAEKRRAEVKEKTNYSENERAEYFKIEEGKNIFRICPPHDNKYPAFEVKVVSWLPQIIEKDGKDTVANRPVFNAKIHGKDADGNDLERDIVEEYVDYMRMKLEDENQDDDEVRKLMGALIGRKGRKGWESGVIPKTDYVAYAFKNVDTLGRLSVTRAQMNRVDELSVDEEADEPISVDLFSDPNDGYSLIIQYDKSQKAKDRYTITRGVRPNAISDDKLEKWWKQDPLYTLFRDVYDMDTFDRAVQGLQIVDEEEGYNAWEDQEWLDIVEELRADIKPAKKKGDDDEDDDEEDKPKKPAAKKPAARKTTPRASTKAKERKPAVKKAVKEDAEDAEIDEENATESIGIGSDNLDLMSREDLMEFIEENELDLIVSKRHSDDTVRGAIRDELAARKEFVEDLHKDDEDGDDDPFKGVGSKYKKK